MSIQHGILMGLAAAAFVAAVLPKASLTRRNVATLLLLALALMVRWLPK